MTDISHRRILVADPDRATTRAWPLLPYLLVLGIGTTGLLVGRAMGGRADEFETSLLLLLRFMATMKVLAVMAAAFACHWRLAQPIDRGLALGYLVTLVPMALAVGLIWSLGGIAIGAVLFHVGLLAFLCLAWKDGGIRLHDR